MKDQAWEVLWGRPGGETHLFYPHSIIQNSVPWPHLILERKCEVQEEEKTVCQTEGNCSDALEETSGLECMPWLFYLLNESKIC